MKIESLGRKESQDNSSLGIAKEKSVTYPIFYRYALSYPTPTLLSLLILQNNQRKMEGGLVEF